LSHRVETVIAVATCPGSLIVHRDGTVAGCTNDDDQGSRGKRGLSIPDVPNDMHAADFASS